MPSPRRRHAAIGLAALLVAAFAIVAVAQGLGHPTPGADEIAVVEDATNGEAASVTREEYESALEQTALRQGLEEVPEEDHPQYELLRDSAIADLLLAVWIRGEAAERGVEVTSEQVDEELEQIKEQQFDGREQRFQEFLEQSGFTEEEALDRVELQILSDEVQGAVLPEEPDVGEDEIESFYEANPEQFEQPETRDARVIVTDDEEDADEARERLEEDDSPGVWRQVAEDLSTDEATQEQGGLRQGLVEGQAEPALDEQVFTSPEDDLVGPFEGEEGFYVLQVQEINPTQQVPLEDASEQIRQAIAGQRQQEIAQEFQAQFLEKWRSRTFCADGFEIERCANAEQPVIVCPEEVAEQQGCPAPVPSTRPIEPGTAALFGEAPGRPQGPIVPEPEQPLSPEGLPPGLEQIPEAPPPGEVPPGEAPPGEVPPGEAPPPEPAPPPDE